MKQSFTHGGRWPAAAQLLILLILVPVFWCNAEERWFKPNEYLVVSHEHLAGNEIMDLVDFLELYRGLNVEYRFIEDGMTAQDVRDSISDFYENTDLLPVYVLLVGSTRRGAERVSIFV